jgi:uncharacterized protein (TIGR00369 family)
MSQPGEAMASQAGRGTNDSRALPWSESCFVCGDANDKGLKVRFRVDGDLVRVNTALDPRHEGYPGYAHGGVISALLDETGGWACSAATGRLFYTVELTVRFKLPVPGGQPITVEARCTEANRRLSRAEAWIMNQEQQVLASAQGLYYPLPGSRHDEIVRHLKMPGRPARQEDI